MEYSASGAGAYTAESDSSCKVACKVCLSLTASSPASRLVQEDISFYEARLSPDPASCTYECICLFGR